MSDEEISVVFTELKKVNDKLDTVEWQTRPPLDAPAKAALQQECESFLDRHTDELSTPEARAERERMAAATTLQAQHPTAKVFSEILESIHAKLETLINRTK